MQYGHIVGKNNEAYQKSEEVLIDFQLSDEKMVTTGSLIPMEDHWK